MLACICIEFSDGAKGENLIPETPGHTPDYWCTWAAQNYIWGQGEKLINNDLLFRGAGLKTGRQNVNEKEIFKPQGWATLFPKVRGDLIFIVDDGYYPGTDMTSLQLDGEKFPSYRDSNPMKSLLRFNLDLKKAGWRGLGLWTRGVAPTPESCKERMQWSKDAGVLYWKIDTNDNQLIYAGMKGQLAPALMLEYSIGMRVLNTWPDGRVAPNYGTSRLKMLKSADVVRIYDRDQPLSLPTSIDRVKSLLQVASGQTDAQAIINCEDELYLGAALGCSVGIFRTPYRGLRPSGDMDIYMGGPRFPKKCMDEVTRAIRWHRLAPPYAASLGPINVDTALLSDSWVFAKGDSWDTSLTGKLITQSAPARVSRGIPLPGVKAVGAMPWVLASRNPNQAISVAALGRISPERGYFIPRADIELQAGAIPPAIGIFGRYKSLTLQFDQALGSKAIVMAQDLAGETSVNISKRVAITDTRLIIPGALIDEVGLSSASAGDLSEPGLVITIQRSSSP